MDSPGCENDVKTFSLVKNEVMMLNVDEYTTSIDISNKLKINKKKINKQLYKLQKEGVLKMVPSNPPKWFKNCNCEDSENNDNKLESRDHVPHHIFKDEIPYKKIISWKDKTPCTVINEYCQLTSRDWSIEVTTAGESHCPIFTASVIISGIKFKPEIGNTKKEAKHKASKITMEEILKSSIVKF
ncbi:34L [Yaba monkey tumor virus]|uniref:34L n=1 Tax=Yaba monkey tumor virus (strain VR587) TaxID=928314 RepID=Q6TUX8_YMTV5|nr:double-strand RNA-binding protein [Yaba monkey tumor virus]AAR07391.1 34L [Yaba monkey tumor virus]